MAEEVDKAAIWTDAQMRMAFDEVAGKQTVIHEGPMWIDGNGRKIYISAMDTDHIINCILIIGDKMNRIEKIVGERATQNLLLSAQIVTWENSIEQFLDELDRRTQKFEVNG